MNGILVVNKDKGMTSHDVVFKLRKILQTKKVGHAGTLDPEVDGVLVVCVGAATKVSQFMMAGTKTYRGEVTIGFSTETEDAHGATIETKAVEVNQWTAADIDAVCASLVGRITQIPPMYSAVKVKGKKLYEYARAGQSVERPSREVDVFSLEWEPETLVFVDGTMKFSFTVTSSKGLYVRTLAVQMGEALGYPAHMSNLRRLGSGVFTLDQAQTLAEITENGPNLKSIAQALRVYPHFQANEHIAKLVRNGVVLRANQIPFPLTTPEVVVYDEEVALAVYGPHPSKPDLWKVIRGFRQEEEM
ncbi:MAG: tRNA pseudouridine(55) synthase TruB [Culicoidibacterales bacterium]